MQGLRLCPAAQQRHDGSSKNHHPPVTRQLGQGGGADVQRERNLLVGGLDHLTGEDEVVCQQLDESRVEEDARTQRVEHTRYDVCGGRVGVVAATSQRIRRTASRNSRLAETEANGQAKRSDGSVQPCADKGDCAQSACDTVGSEDSPQRYRAGSLRRDSLLPSPRPSNVSVRSSGLRNEGSGRRDGRWKTSTTKRVLKSETTARVRPMTMLWKMTCAGQPCYSHLGLTYSELEDHDPDELRNGVAVNLIALVVVRLGVVGSLGVSVFRLGGRRGR